MNSNAPKIPLVYISKTNVNCFGPLPNNTRKIQSQESLQGPIPLLLVIKSSSFCGLKKVGQGLGLRPRSPPSLKLFFGSKMLQISSGPGPDVVPDSQALQLWCVCVGGRVSISPPTKVPFTGLKVLPARGMPVCTQRESPLPLCSFLPATLPCGYFQRFPCHELLDTPC